MRRRDIISCILTIVLLAITWHGWLIIKPKVGDSVYSTVKVTHGGGGGVSMLQNNALEEVSNNKLSTRRSIKFDAMMFIIIAILGYLLSYRLTSYLADFKIEKHYSRIDIVFLAVCAVIMYLPMSHISDSKKSEAENRNLAVWKPLIKKDGKLNFNFGRDYDKWFSDRFNCRQLLLDLNSFISYNLNNDYDTKGFIYNKKNGCAFVKSSNSEQMFLKNNLFSEQELNNIKSNVTRLNNYCKKHNVKLYFLLSSDKESIYPELYPAYYHPKKNEDRLQQVVNNLSKFKSLNIIFPRPQLLQAKNDGVRLFLNGETHYSPQGYCAKGSFIEYNAIIDAVHKDFKNVNPLREDEFELKNIEIAGDIFKPDKLMLKKWGHETAEVMMLKQPHVVRTNFVTYDDRDDNIAQYVNNKSGNRLNVVMVGDCFHSRYREILAENFAKFDSIFIGGGRDYVLRESVKNMVFKNNKPDILIIETTERFVKRLANLGSFMDIFDDNM